MPLTPVFALKEFVPSPLAASDLNTYVSNSLLYLNKFGGEQATDWPLSPAINQRVYRTDFRADFVYDGTSWVQTSVGTFNGLYPSNPVTGLRVFRSDLPEERTYNGSSWVTMTSVSDVRGVLPAANGGTGVNNGTNTLTIPTSGTAILRNNAGTANRVAIWTDANKVGDASTLTYSEGVLGATSINTTGNISAGGNLLSSSGIGIGVTSVSRPVHVRHIGASMLFQRLDGALPGFFLSVFTLANLDTPTRVFYIGGIGDDSVGFRDHGTTEGGGGTVRLRVTSTGSVLIGRDTGLTGAGQLDVNSSIRAANNVTLSSTGISVASGNLTMPNGSSITASGGTLTIGTVNATQLTSSGNGQIIGILSVNDYIQGESNGPVKFNRGINVWGISAPWGYRPSVSGSRGGNIALAQLLSTLATYGLIIDNTTA